MCVCKIYINDICSNGVGLRVHTPLKVYWGKQPFVRKMCHVSGQAFDVKCVVLACFYSYVGKRGI